MIDALFAGELVGWMPSLPKNWWNRCPLYWNFGKEGFFYAHAADLKNVIPFAHEIVPFAQVVFTMGKFWGMMGEIK